MTATQLQASAGGAFRRPTREHAIELARAHFLAGERIEMGSLAAELDIGRTTLYRWVGEREQLLGEVFGRIVDQWVAEVEPDARGFGIERFLDVISRYLRLAVASAPLTEFTQREPALAMRVLINRGGPVAEHSVSEVRRMLREFDPDLRVPDEIVDAIWMISISHVWALIATEQAPDVDRAMFLIRTLLNACAHGLA